MKIKLSILFFTLILFGLNACRSFKFEKRKYRSGFHIEIGKRIFDQKKPTDSNEMSVIPSSSVADNEKAEPKDKKKNNGMNESHQNFQHQKVLETSINSLNKVTVKPDTSNTSDDSLKILTVSLKVGETIDSTEKATYKLFPFWKNGDFESAQFVQDINGNIFLIGKMKNGSTKKIRYTHEDFRNTTKKYFNEDLTYENSLYVRSGSGDNKSPDNKMFFAVLLTLLIILIAYLAVFVLDLSGTFTIFILVLAIAVLITFISKI